ncbi:MAG: IS4 family transposase [Bacteroidetes bacterium]|nr:IS4 family transposase [Bacteroidota bacterium]
MHQDYRGFVITGKASLSGFRENYFDEVINTIEDEKFVNRSRSQDGGKGFTRNRKITFKHLITLLTQGLSRSLQRELNSFYQRLQGTDFSIQHVTKGAFSRSRSKLKPEAFSELNQVGLRSFYKNAPWRSFNGFRLLAIDGSTAVLPNHESITEQFGTVCFGPYADSPRSVARISVLYDVLNLTVLDGQMGSYTQSERDLARNHFTQVVAGKDLVIFDRGYPSLELMSDMQSRGIEYVLRIQEKWWLEARQMIADGIKDKQVTFRLPVSKKDQHEKNKKDRHTIKCRLVCVPLPDGGSEVLCTSITDEKVLPYDCFSELYHYRWNVEEGYKLFKSRLQLEAFSGKTALAVRQDFYAKLFTMTTTAVMLFPIEEKLKKEAETQERKHPHKVNRTNALSMIKENITKVFISKIVRPVLQAIDKVLKATTEIVRPNRKFKRKKIKKKPPSMNYKQL